MLCNSWQKMCSFIIASQPFFMEQVDINNQQDIECYENNKDVSDKNVFFFFCVFHLSIRKLRYLSLILYSVLLIVHHLLEKGHRSLYPDPDCFLGKQ
jgi:hypothetical protein